jgi:O-methyltransferase domain/Dimerisation domain
MNPAARSQAFGLLAGFMVTQALGSVVRLEIAELVSERPRTPEELAAASGADPDALRRVLRTLASVGFFSVTDGIVRHTELSEYLLDGVPGSIRWHALLFSSVHYRTWSDAHETFRTGEHAFGRMFGGSYFDWLSAHAEDALIFNRAMAAGAAGRLQAVVERDWSGVETVVDVGGGTGAILTAILVAHPHLRGVVFDLPHARDGAEAAIAAAGVEDRCVFVTGSFFEEVPAGADVYLLSHILHDWGDEQATAILRVCRSAAKETSRLVLFEAVLRPGDESDWRKLLDLHMLVLLGGRERNEDEWRDLLAQGGFELLPAEYPQEGSVLEATPAAAA